MKIPVGVKVTVWYVKEDMERLDDFLNKHQIVKIKTFKANNSTVMIIAYMENER